MKANKLFLLSIFVLVSLLLITSCNSKKNNEKIPLFVEGDSIYVTMMAEEYMNRIKAHEYPEAFNMLIENLIPEPTPLSEERMTELYNHYQTFPIINYKLKSAEFNTETDVKLVYSVEFFEKDPESNIPNTYNITFAPRRINADWYLSIKEH